MRVFYWVVIALMGAMARAWPGRSQEPEVFQVSHMDAETKALGPLLLPSPGTLAGSQTVK